MSAAGSFAVDGLDVHYGGRKVLDSVTFSVAAGEALGIVGESGSGKTTTAMAAVGLLDPESSTVTARSIRLDGIDMTPGSPRRHDLLGRRIGVVFQNPMVALNPVLTVERQLTDHMRFHLGLDRRQARARAVTLLGEVGIADAEARLSSYPFQFSGGMLQRITIAMALACDPDLLIADEPTTALDATVQADVVDLVLSIRRTRSLSLVWITHDLALLNLIADRVMVMYGGRMAELGPAGAVLATPGHPYSQGLLGSVHSLWEEEGAIFRTIDGVPPPQGATMPGCPFEPRCRRADHRCASQPPAFAVNGQGDHLAACWRVAEQAS